MRTTRVLIADSRRPSLERLGSELTARGCDVFLAFNARDLSDVAASCDSDVALISVDLAGRDGLAAARALRALSPDTSVILIADEDDLARRATDLVRSRFAVLPVDLPPDRVAQAVQGAGELRRLKDENRILRGEWEEHARPEDLVVRSPSMIDALRQAATAADAAAPVTLHGPPGSEADVVALYIHRCSPRADGPFVRFQCGRHPAPEEEGYLFGRVWHSTEGALVRRSGHLELADAGTLYLNHVDELAPACQAILLRFIDEGRFLPRGAAAGRPSPTRADVRIVASLSGDARSGAPGGLRADLLHRLGRFSIFIPPLAERPEDILPLARRFMRRFAVQSSKDLRALTPEAERLLLDYPWPGNVAELRNCIRTAVAGSERGVLTADDLLTGPCRAGGGRPCST